jgi:hypothetical protein
MLEDNFLRASPSEFAIERITSGKIHSLSKDETAPATVLPGDNDAIRLLCALVKNLSRNYGQHLLIAQSAMYLDLSFSLNGRYNIGHASLSRVTLSE